MNAGRRFASHPRPERRAYRGLFVSLLLLALSMIVFATAGDITLAAAVAFVSGAWFVLSMRTLAERSEQSGERSRS